ncbi:hypothetical protein SERLA73DRAFT_69462 [Serpula lacrymans var. lacrymans S7.3]|uniref:Uncharacterized protein n=1 Tax=Serpula lacrymans var. lacrymans (strain S7.3) TaxID=936435 RepID=F8PKX0_SERL3|nr:hypothetical protein SERLA73DRAFT_69462 [Serpula lacrymans var. lacrymans S7.3]
MPLSIVGFRASFSLISSSFTYLLIVIVVLMHYSHGQPTEEDFEDAQESDDWLDDIALLVDPARPLPYHPMSLPSFLTSDSSQYNTLCRIFHFLQTMELPIFSSLQA